MRAFINLLTQIIAVFAILGFATEALRWHLYSSQNRCTSIGSVYYSDQPGRMVAVESWSKRGLFICDGSFDKDIIVAK